MLFLIMTVLTLLEKASAASPPVMSTTNRWAEPARRIVEAHCGQCHVPNLPTSVPRALAVFNLREGPWYGRLTHRQYDVLLRRLGSIDAIPEPDRSIIERFVRCARDQVCPSDGP